jgi:hypothetical protein
MNHFVRHDSTKCTSELLNVSLREGFGGTVLAFE